MYIVLGEILFDIFPGYKRLGGAPFNFAYHVTRFGVPVHFITRVGDDPEGRDILDRLNACGFHSLDVQVDGDHPTGRVDISLDDQSQPTFHIVPDVAYDYLLLDKRRIPFDRAHVRLVYYGTLIQRTRRGFRAVQALLNALGDDTRRFYDINLRPNSYSMDVVRASLQSADILKLNDSELAVLGKELYRNHTENATIDRLMRDFQIDTIALTKGADGSILVTPSGRYERPSPPVHDIADTVGAGDAYAAVLALGLDRKRPPEPVLDAATRFAADICRIEGAIPTDPAIYDDRI